jgi:hypothetical protein
MTTEEFWEKYINQNILEIFDVTCDFFTKALPKEFIDNYDVGEVILETRGHQETAKNFDNVIKFTDILQNKQPQLYKEYFQYFDDFLIDYHCFRQDSLNVRKALTLFMDNPLHDYDKYLLGFKKILFYQQTDLIEQAISKNFSAVNNSDDLMGNAEYDLAICRYYILLQEIHEKNDNILNRTAFSSKLSDYNFEFENNFLSSLETGILKPMLDADNLKDLLKKDKKSAIIIIQGYFLRDMHTKGFAFYLSGKIWDKMLGFWQENNSSKKTADTYFKVKIELFEKYLAGFSSNMFLDNKSEMIAILWGSVYIYEFFYKSNIISEEFFLDFIETTKELKGKVIGQYTPDLWNSNFIHSWEKPECISETEFVEENKIFQKSISFKYQKFTRHISSISEELSKIGELSHFIIEGGNYDPKTDDTSLLDNLFNPPVKEIGGFDNHSNISEPIRVEKKVGRNEPCPCGSGKKYKKCCG